MFEYTVTLTIKTELDHPTFVQDFVRRAVDGYLNQETGETVTDVTATPITDFVADHDLPFFLKKQAN